MVVDPQKPTLPQGPTALRGDISSSRRSQGVLSPGQPFETKAIGQDRLQDWIANHIKARKVLILLDTGKSVALVAGHTTSRLNAPATGAAVGRLHEHLPLGSRCGYGKR